ncbi:hypothetical protein PP175_25740 (plasmid) [Aneurinibacillus sp. Ricciae_BoGa-3]|uniref:hypothetical protein n=1 Tax=Aneurinibacillus sp. Ricciae_BoGa-3 TaxID=3022697 RepID=UPI0023425E8F|nr:hypothetical protein [Aneurinibacillus sp. Ricciae_BoGa-3]WCK57471.1 hypothetical protein PP175_25740 [Aneurinibacillus sp. Ricciae_BoGa-3]
MVTKNQNHPSTSFTLARYVMGHLGSLLYWLFHFSSYDSRKVSRKGEESKMKQKYLCLKDFKMSNVIYFEKGKYYDGKEKKNNIGNGVKSATITGEFAKRVDFHTGSEYFNID